MGVNSQLFSENNKQYSNICVTQLAKTVIIVGMGPVGVALANQLCELQAIDQILVFGDEPYQPYDRVQLSNLLAEECSLAKINIRVSDKKRIHLIHAKVVSIDRVNKTISDNYARIWPYEKLVLATGSRPYLPLIPGINKDGVYTFRSLQDTQQLLRCKLSSRKIVVLGAGLLGLETAKAMKTVVNNVTIIHHSSRLMANQLDTQSSELVLNYLQQQGIKVYFNTTINQICGVQHVSVIDLSNGQSLQCDTLVICTGVAANTRLATEAGLAVDRGIKVDDHLLTSDPHIYAIGECAQHRGQVYGLLGPGIEQARVAAKNLVGNQSQYLGSMAASFPKVLSLKVFTMGVSHTVTTPYKQFVYYDRARTIYRKLIIRDSIIVGVIAVGLWSQLPQVQVSIIKKAKLGNQQLMTFVKSGDILPVQPPHGLSHWHQDELICHCNAITLGELRQALKQGCNSVQMLAQQTGASTVCGSCSNLLVELVTGNKKIAKSQQQSFTRLMNSLLFSFVLLLLWFITPAIPSGQSIHDWQTQLSQFWLNANYKQISGYSLLILLLLAQLLSARKRLARFTFGRFPIWRLVHTWLAGLLLLILVLHTGFHIGEQLNAVLMINFLLVATIGVLVGFSFFLDKYLPRQTTNKLKSMMAKLHIYVAWPLPLLILFHILTVYYF